MEKKVAIISLVFGVLMLLGGLAVGYLTGKPALPSYVTHQGMEAVAPLGEVPAVEPAPAPAPQAVPVPQAPDPLAPDPPAPEVQVVETGYAVVAGVYFSPQLAEERRRHLQALGYAATVVSGSYGGEKVTFMVVAKVVPNYQAALEAAVSMRSKDGVSASVQRMGPPAPPR